MQIAVSRDCPSGVLFLKRPDHITWSDFIDCVRDAFQDCVVNWLIPFDVIVMIPRGMTHVDWSWGTIP